MGPECAEGMAISVKQQRGAAVERIRNKAVDMLLGTAAGGDGGEKGYQVRGKPDAGLFYFIFCFPLDSLHANKTKTHTTRSHSSEGPPSRLTREAEGVWPNCRGRKAKPTRSLNARSAHPGVAPGYFRCCCFASTRKHTHNPWFARCSQQRGRGRASPLPRVFTHIIILFLGSTGSTAPPHSATFFLRLFEVDEAAKHSAAKHLLHTW